MRFPTPRTNAILQAQILQPRQLLRLGYLWRLSVASGVLLAAVTVWGYASSEATTTASLLFIAAAVFTAASATYTEVARRRPGTKFIAVQALFDLALVTALVHVTGRRDSGFPALYLLVIASAAFLLPRRVSAGVALLGCALYVVDTVALVGLPLTARVLLQLGAFAIVALAAGYFGARLRELGVGRAELAAELHQARFQATDILSHIRSGIITIDARRQLRYANPAASALLGIELDGRLGAPIMAELATIAPALAEALGRAAGTGERTSRAEGTATVGGRTFPIGVTTTFAEGPAAAAGWTMTAIFQDISAQKQLESLNMRAQRLEAVAELSASLAHEIKNPLASIRSAVEQLARTPAPDEDDARTLSTLIVRESDRLDRLMIEFLDFARVRVTRTAPVDLGAIARAAAGLAAAHPDRRPGVEVVCSAPESPLVVHGDEDLLHRAVFNLALNGVQAVPERGRVVVEVAPVGHDDLPTGLAFQGGAVALRVSDDGPGIPAEVRDILFDPFVTTKAGGSGLGLPIVHRAVEAHSGVVLVDSSDAGTRFTVLLPPAFSPRNDPA